MLRVDWRAALRQRAVDAVIALECRGFGTADPGLDAGDGGMVDQFRRRPGAEGGGKIALLDAAVVAIPMQLHALLLRLVPDRREVGHADQFFPGQLLERRTKNCLG